MEKYEIFNQKALRNFAGAMQQAQEIWPEDVRRDAYREWAVSMRQLEGLDQKTKAIVLSTLLPIIVTSEEVEPEIALQNTELLFLAILESMTK